MRVLRKHERETTSSKGGRARRCGGRVNSLVIRGTSMATLSLAYMEGCVGVVDTEAVNATRSIPMGNVG